MAGAVSASVVYGFLSVECKKRAKRRKTPDSDFCALDCHIRYFHIFKILEVLLDLIPRHFFKKFFEILNALHIIAIWHYIVIIASIGFALLAIYIIQKKIFNKRRLQIKRLTKGLCFHCGKKLPPNAGICPFCSTDQQKNCPSCDHLPFAAWEFCTICGKEL